MECSAIVVLLIRYLNCYGHFPIVQEGNWLTPERVIISLDLIDLIFFKLYLQIATDNHHPQIAAHAPWETRSFMDSDAQNIAYSAHQ